MTILQYLKEKKSFLAYATVLFVFILVFLLTQPGNIMRLGDYHYLMFIYLCLTLFYLVVDYLKMNRFWRQINEVLTTNETLDNIAALPKGHSTQQKMFMRSFRQQVKNYHRYVSKSIDKDKEKQNYALYWAHEIKTPIIASKMILKDNKAVLPEKVYQQLLSEMNEVDRLTMQSLYFSRLDSFEIDYLITEINAERIVKDAIKRQATAFINKRIKLNINVPEIWIRSDSKWLSYVCDQIISNAVKYTPQGGDVSCCLEADGRQAKLMISDTGPGIPIEDHQRVFEKGYTGIQGRNTYKSTGMGLYLAKEMSKKLGHVLSLESIEDVGTTVSIIFETKEQYFMPENEKVY